MGQIMTPEKPKNFEDKIKFFIIGFKVSPSLRPRDMNALQNI